jgi:hypothetical protein
MQNNFVTATLPPCNDWMTPGNKIYYRVSGSESLTFFAARISMADMFAAAAG